MNKPYLSQMLCVVCVLLLSSCGKYNLSAVNAYRPTYEDFAVDLGNKKIDVLFVVDNSGSMSDEQATLARSISGFISNFSGKPIDYHIGVITTDTVMNPNQGVNVNYSGSNHSFPLSSFAIFDGPGSLFIRNVDLNGNYIIDRSAMGFDINSVPKYLDSMTMSSAAIVSRFSLDALPGINGSGNEASLLSISKFLQADKLAGWNAGFLRSDSLFSTVIITDEDESATPCDANSPDAYLKSQACLDRMSSGGHEADYVQNIPAAKAARLDMFNTIFKAQRAKHPALLSLDTVLALNAKYPDGSTCSGDPAFGSMLQEVSKSYNRESNKSSKIHNICVSDFSTQIGSIGNVLATSVENEFELAADRVDPATVAVEINGTLLQASDYAYDAQTNRVKISDFGLDTTLSSGLLNIRIYYDKRLDLTDK